jgi:hypothetical protein
MPLIMRPGLMGGRIGRPGLLGLAARTAVVAGTAGAVGNRMQRRQEERAAAEAPPEPAYAPPPEPAGVDATDRRLEQLKELASLRSQGVLTDEEFATQKAAVLAGR